MSCAAKVVIYKSCGEPFFMEQNSRLGLVWGRLAVLKPAQSKLKYATLRVFLYVFMGKTLWVALKYRGLILRVT